MDLAARLTVAWSAAEVDSHGSGQFIPRDPRPLG